LGPRPTPGEAERPFFQVNGLLKIWPQRCGLQHRTGDEPMTKCFPYHRVHSQGHHDLAARRILESDVILIYYNSSKKFSLFSGGPSSCHTGELFDEKLSEGCLHQTNFSHLRHDQKSAIRVLSNTNALIS
jgi:hypothetical protein